QGGAIALAIALRPSAVSSSIACGFGEPGIKGGAQKGIRRVSAAPEDIELLLRRKRQVLSPGRNDFADYESLTDALRWAAITRSRILARRLSVSPNLAGRIDGRAAGHHGRTLRLCHGGH